MAKRAKARGGAGNANSIVQMGAAGNGKTIKLANPL